MSTRLNIGCGEARMDGYVNVDALAALKPDVVLDISFDPWPWEDGSVERIICSHTIEHIEKPAWDWVFYEMNRVLKLGGTLFLSYPEFATCVSNWLENKQGRRNFWEQTIFGRDCRPFDAHRAVASTSEVVMYLEEYGFEEIVPKPEPMQDFNTFVTAKKGRTVFTRAEVLGQEMFGGATTV